MAACLVCTGERIVLLDSEDKLASAVAELGKADKRMAELMAQVGPCRMAPWERPVFDAVVGAIISQQLSTRAAATIRKRLLDVCSEAAGMTVAHVDPDVLMSLPTEALRGIGLSGAKTRAVQELAEHHAAEPSFWRDLQRMSDAEVEKALCRLRGIGPWTAHMVMMFSLGRPDVWPVGDLGIRKAMQRWLDLPALPEPDALHAPAEIWMPFRTVAAWYLWRSLEMAVVI
jgi:DNA-3-methyladenine glycosylase II